MKHRKSIRLLPEEDGVLRELYKQYRVPIEQYHQRPELKLEFTLTWNEATSRSDTADELFHYMVTRRKDSRGGGWVRFDGTHHKLRNPAMSVFEDSEWEFLVAWLQQRRVTADQLATDSDLAGELAQNFSHHTGRAWAPNVIVAALIARRKRGLLPALPPPTPDDGDVGFADIDMVG